MIKKKTRDDIPEVHVLKKNDKEVQFHRRDFIKGLSVLAGSTLIGCSNSIKSVKSNSNEEVMDEITTEPDKIDADECGSIKAHSSAVTSISYSPNGKTLASGSEDNNIKLWSVSKGKFLKTLKGHKKYVLSVCFSPGGNILASGSGDENIKIWSFPGGKLLKTMDEHTGSVNAVAFNRSGKILASGGSDNNIKLWASSSWKLLKTLQSHTGKVFTVCFSPDGKILASGSGDNTIKLWSIPDGNLVATLLGHTGVVNTVCFSPDGKYLASGSSDHTIIIWSIPDGEPIDTRLWHKQVNTVDFSPDGKFLASGSTDSTVKLWSFPEMSLQKIIEGHAKSITSLCFNPKGKSLASGSVDKSIKIWSWSSNTEIESDLSYQESLNSISPPFNIRENYVFGSSNPEELLLVDLDKNVTISTVVGGGKDISAVNIFPNLKYLITGDLNGRVKWCNIDDEKDKGNFKAQKKEIVDILVLRDNKTLITTGAEGTSKFWSFPDKTCIKELFCSSVTLSPDEKILASIDRKKIIIRSLDDYSVVGSVDFNSFVNCMTFAPKSNHLIIGTNSGYDVYDYEKDDFIAKFKSSFPIFSISVENNENYLAFICKRSAGYEVGINSYNEHNELKRFVLDKKYSKFPPFLKFLDEKKLITCYDKIKIFFFTDYIDDVILSQCLYDKDELAKGTKGVQYKVGSTTMTLPCGSPIPAGAVCTCNCVSVGPAVNTTTYYYTYYYTYWYPN